MLSLSFVALILIASTTANPPQVETAKDIKFYWNDAAVICFAIRTSDTRDLGYRFTSFQKCINANLRPTISIPLILRCPANYEFVNYKEEVKLPQSADLNPIFVKDCNDLYALDENTKCATVDTYPRLNFYCSKTNGDLTTTTYFLGVKDIYSSITNCSRNSIVQYYFDAATPSGCRMFRPPCTKIPSTAYATYSECIKANDKSFGASNAVTVNCPAGLTPYGEFLDGTRFSVYSHKETVNTDADPCPSSSTTVPQEGFTNFCCISPVYPDDPISRTHYWH